MKRALILSTLILSLITACFTSPDVSAAAACGDALCGKTPETTTPIQFEEKHVISPLDANMALSDKAASNVYSLHAPTRGYIFFSYGANDATTSVSLGESDNAKLIANFNANDAAQKVCIASGDYVVATRQYNVGKEFTPHFIASSSCETTPYNNSFRRAQEILANQSYTSATNTNYSNLYYGISLPASGRITLGATGTSFSYSSLGIYTYDDSTVTARKNEYNDLKQSAQQNYQQCIADDAQGVNCHQQYLDSLPTWSEYYEGASTIYSYDNFTNSEYFSHPSPSIMLQSGTYYIKAYAINNLTLRVNYTSDSGVVEKASSLNTNSNITLTSLKGTTLSGATISRPEMVQQLMNQGYRKADAIAAVDSLGIDFSYNAVRQALAIRAENPKQTFNDITYGLLKTTYNFNNFQRRKARTILARWVATGEIK